MYKKTTKKDIINRKLGVDKRESLVLIDYKNNLKNDLDRYNSRSFFL